jgi:hypothetical protein
MPAASYPLQAPHISLNLGRCQLMDLCKVHIWDSNLVVYREVIFDEHKVLLGTTIPQ